MSGSRLADQLDRGAGASLAELRAMVDRIPVSARSCDRRGRRAEPRIGSLALDAGLRSLSSRPRAADAEERRDWPRRCHDSVASEGRGPCRPRGGRPAGSIGVNGLLHLRRGDRECHEARIGVDDRRARSRERGSIRSRSRMTDAVALVSAEDRDCRGSWTGRLRWVEPLRVTSPPGAGTEDHRRPPDRVRPAVH